MNRILRIRQSDRQVFDQLQSGRKRVETRALSSKYSKLAPGDTVTFVCGDQRLAKTIRTVRKWKTIDAMLRVVPYLEIFPDAPSTADVKRVYASFPGYAEKIRAHGIVAFEFEEEPAR